MAKSILIERPNGMVTIVRSELETASEDALTEHEEIINELYSKVKESDSLPCVSGLFCQMCGKPLRTAPGVIQELCECPLLVK
jgi:hypothetical protein